ncbi:MAG: phosphoribosylformylglycinamidine synthase I [Anaerolineales bacterium]
MQPRALVLLANGTNRDQEAAAALELAGARAEIVPLNQLRMREKTWADYQVLVLPGGFSYADALGAGKLLALDLEAYFADEVHAFVEGGKPVIGICNGFQALVKAGLIPNSDGGRPTATLTFNASGRFECRWVTLVPQSRTCVWTRDLTGLIYCPVAHGEGRFALADPTEATELMRNDQVAFVYSRRDGSPASGSFPENPNGSLKDIAGVCNPEGNVLGLMPHPEDHIYRYQHPRWTRGESGETGLGIFENGVRYAAQL